jgi:hypothetical protein
VLTARRCPSSNLAAKTGIVSDTVTHMMTGTCRLQLNDKGEVLSGEATRLSNEGKSGVANVYGPRGPNMSCEYQMTTPHPAQVIAASPTVRPTRCTSAATEARIAAAASRAALMRFRKLLARNRMNAR